MNKLILLFTFLVIFSCNQKKSSIKQQNAVARLNREGLPGILDSIRAINEVQYEHVGIVGIESENYKNFLALATIDTLTLLRLTGDTNAVIVCYAGWALIDQSYPNINAILVKFLTNDKVVRTLNGCIESQDLLSNEFYHRYWNRVDESKRKNDRTLFHMDSTILYSNSYWLLTLRALENRIYPPSFNKQIEHLAFDETNRDAINYLIKWQRNQYKDKIKISLLKYLNETDFINVGVTPYFETVDELLKFNDAGITEVIVRKLKKDTHWKYEEEKFLSLLEKYGIQKKDIL
jgi:hypothetical protein